MKKYKSYLDWIKLVYVYHQEEMEKLATIRTYNKDEVFKICDSKDDAEDIDMKYAKDEQIMKKMSEIKIDKEEQERIAKLLEYEYEYKNATTIPTKTSVTEIKDKMYSVQNFPEKKEENVESEIKMPLFLQKDRDTKITNAQKGTLIHLCMQKLDLNKKNYTFNDVKELVDELEAKKIITSKEAEAININKIYQFTRSKIWNEMIEAKEVQREKPFYINIPAKEIYKEDLEEKVLVQGVIDLYYINSNGELVLVDFKTDYVENRDENILIDKYKVQLNLYKRALSQALNRDVDRIYIYSTYFDKEIIY